MSNSFIVANFDKIVQTFYEGNNNIERQKAQTILTDFQKDPDSWQLVDQILEQSCSLQSKFIALGILESFIKVKWNLLPMDQRLAMRNYIVKLIIDLCSDESVFRSKIVYINKLDQILIQILKKDWPKYWPSFIQEIIDSSLINMTLCENNMKILKYLSEEVFDFSNDFMTVNKKNKLKNQMINEFNPVFDLCKKILSAETTNTYLAIATLESLLKFISWIPACYLYQQDLIQILELNFKQAKSPKQRNLCLECFIELINLDNIDMDQSTHILFNIFGLIHADMIQTNIDLNQMYEDASNEDQEFIQNQAIFLTSFLTKFDVLFNSINNGTIIYHDTLKYLLKISRIQEREIWKICLEFWNHLTNNILQSGQIVYQDILQDLSCIMIDNMVKPDDIFLIENDEGEITREFIKQSDTTSLSKLMQQVFQSLTRIQPIYIQNMIHERLKQLLSSTWSWDQLFHLSWAVGFTAGALPESQYPSTSIQDLFQLLQKQQNDDQGWVVASCLFYTIKQYPQFLTTHWEFALLLFQKIFEYMQDSHSGVRDMACNAFVKVVKCSKNELSRPLFSEQSLLVFSLSNIQKFTTLLNSQQLCLFYEAVSTLVSSEANFQIQKQSITLLMEIPNNAVRDAIINMNTISSLKSLNSMIRLNHVVCQTLGPLYHCQLQTIMPFLIQIYEISSKQMNNNLEFYHKVRENILKLLEAFILSHENTLQDQGLILNIIQVILVDYKSSKQVEFKESYVLNLMTSLIEKLEDPIWPDLLKEVIDIEYISTLPLITSNFVDHPEFRIEFYRLLQVLNKRCFMELYQSEQLFKLNLDSIMWGTKHTIKDISELALETLFDMIQFVSQMEDEDISSQFFEMFYVRILTDILEILVDPDCRNGFQYQSQVLARMLEMVQEGEIYTRVFNPNQVSNPLMSNVEFLQQYVLDLLSTAFPLLQKDQIEVLVRGMFEYSGELERFQDDIRDFLIDIREVGEESEGQQRADEEFNAELDLLRNL